MRTGLYKRLSNEELVELYKAGESDAFEALLKNTEGLRATLAQRYLNIPGSEFEDLMSEGAIYPYVCIWKRMEFLLHVRLHITLNLKSKESLHSGEKNTIVSRNVVSRMA